MALYNIYKGLNGGFDGASYSETIECDSLEEAEAYAYEEACQEYDNYEGMHGLFNEEEELEENPNLTQNDLDAMRIEDMENWIEYWAILSSEDDDFEEE